MLKRTVRKALQFAAVASAVGLILSGCSGGGGAGSSAAPGITDTTIKIGLLGPFSGPSATYGKAIHTIDAVYQALNEQGGINGRKIETILEDTKCDPPTMRLAVTKLIEQDKVFMLQGGECSAAVIASMPIIKKSGIPFVVAGAANHAIVSPPTKNVFHGWVDNSSGGVMHAKLLRSFIKETGKTRVGVIAQTDEWGQGWAKSFMDGLEFVPLGNGTAPEMVVDGQIAPDVTDATAQVQTLKNAKVDIAFVYAYPDPMSVFLRDAHQQGLDIPIITGGGTYPEDQVDRIGSREAVDNFFSSFCLSAPLTSPELAQYRDPLKKYYPKETFDLNSMLGASGADVNIEILKRMDDDLSWANWIKTAEGITGFESAAASTPVSFKPFDAQDPDSRLGVNSCNAAHLNPDENAEDRIVVISPDWAEWLKVKATGGK